MTQTEDSATRRLGSSIPQPVRDTDTSGTTVNTETMDLDPTGSVSERLRSSRTRITRPRVIATGGRYSNGTTRINESRPSLGRRQPEQASSQSTQRHTQPQNENNILEALTKTLEGMFKGNATQQSNREAEVQSRQSSRVTGSPKNKDPPKQRSRQRSPDRNSSYSSESSPESRRRSNRPVVILPTEAIKPPTFDGTDEEAAEWLLRYKEVAYLNDWSRRSKIRMLRQALTNSAKSWYRGKWDEENPESWEEFENEFKREFVNGNIQDLMRAKLAKLSQKKNQSLKQYYNIAYEQCQLIDKTMPEITKIGYIVGGMLPEPRGIVGMLHCTTIRALQQAVHDYTLHCSSKTSERSPERTVKPKLEVSRPRERSLDRDAIRVRKEQNFCMNCGKQGHYTRGCDKPLDQELMNKRREEWRINPPFKRVNTRDQSRAVFVDPEGQRYIAIEEPPSDLDEPMSDTCSQFSIKPVSGRVKSAAKIHCRINGQLEEAILDTGATITVLPLKLVLQTRTPLYQWNGPQLSLANGTTSAPVGWCEASIEYQGRTHTVNSAVLDDAPDILIGVDYITKASLVICLADQRATYYDSYMKSVDRYLERTTPIKVDILTQTEELPIVETHKVTVQEPTPEPKKVKVDIKPDFKELHVEYVQPKEAIKLGRISIQKPSEEPYRVRSKKKVALPPQTRARIEVTVARDRSDLSPYYIEPTINAGIQAIPGIGRRSTTALDVFNITDRPMMINKRELLGKATPIAATQAKGIEEGKPNPRLNSEQNLQLKQLLEKYNNLFVDSNESIGIVPFLKHEINTGDSPPIRSKPYRVSITEQKKIQQLVDEMLAADIIRPSTSHWASPVVLVKKRGTTDLRFCIDYRKLNKVTRVDPYPIPNMDTVLETLSGNHWFSKLDIKAMYWQVLMDEKSREKTAFVIQCGQYEFNVMPFGLVSAPMTAMRVMNEVTRGMEASCFVFYDDILVFTPDFKSHLIELEKLFKRLSSSNIKLNTKKCSFLLDSVDYLGHVVTPTGIKPDPAKVESIQMFKTPTNITEARSFIGMCNFFRRYIKGFADIARPIHDTIKVNQPFTWTKEAQGAMDELKIKLTSPPVLVHYDTNGELTIRCDASGYGLGAVLMQGSEDKTKQGVIAYTSRTLVAAEKNYATTHKECLAMVHAVKHWRHYLYGKKFKVITDHHALCWLMKTKDHINQLMRWSLLLQEFEFTVHYESGKIHTDADCLSRNPLEHKSDAIEESDIPTWPIHSINRSRTTINLSNLSSRELIKPVYDVKAEQEADVYCSDIMCALNNEELSAKLRKRYKQFKLQDGQLYRRSKQDKSKYLLVLPQSMINFVLTEAHDQPISGHFGVKRTKDILKKRFFWPTLDKDTIDYIKTCDKCQRKKPNNRKEGILMPMPIPKQVFDTLGMDLMGPLPKSINKYIYILVVTDYLSKYVIVKPLKKATSDKIIELLKKHVFYVHGLPRTIITDNGSNLNSSEMKEILDLMKIRHKTTSPYRPQANGQTERYNRVLGTQLAIFAEDKPKTWDLYLEALSFAYNTTVHSSHLSTPYYLAHGREPLKPVDLVIPRAPQDLEDCEETEVEILDTARRFARTLIQESQLRTKRNFERNRNKVSYAIGDLVLKRKPPQELTGCKKFNFPWSHPYMITRKLNDINYQIISTEDPNDDQIVHLSQIKRYNTRRIDKTKGGGTQPEPEEDIDSGILDNNSHEIIQIERVELHKNNTIDGVGRPTVKLKSN